MTGTFFALAFSTISAAASASLGMMTRTLDAGLEQLVGELRLAGPVTFRRLDEDVGLAILRALDEQVAVPLPALVQRVHQQADLQPPASRRLRRTSSEPPHATAARATTPADHRSADFQFMTLSFRPEMAPGRGTF